MNPIQEIDEVLNSFARSNASNDDGINILKKAAEPAIRQQEILRKLEKDGYIRPETITQKDMSILDKDITFYVLTFEGELFQQSGGYTSERAFLNEMDKLPLENDKNQKRLNRITCYLTIGTFFLVVVEIAKFLLEHYYYPCCP